MRAPSVLREKFVGKTSRCSFGYDSRCYDGGTGRVLTQDSIQPPVLGPTDTNLYVYGRASRLGYADPGWLAVPFKSACPEAPPSYSSTRLRSGRV